jgi:hypothetical protein
MARGNVSLSISITALTSAACLEATLLILDFWSPNICPTALPCRLWD